MSRFTKISVTFFFLLTLFLSTSQASVAQKITHFSGDSTKFIGELNIYFSNLVGNEQKMTAKLMEGFIQKWNSEQYTSSKKKIIYQLCNQMLKKRIRTYPDFFNYIDALNIFVDSHQPDKTFYDWSDILKKLINNKNIHQYTTFLEMTIDLFDGGYTSKSSSTRWKIRNPVFRFINDSIPRIDFYVSDVVCYTNSDSMVIFHTKGVYYPLTYLWMGEGGRVDWRKAGLEPEKVYADLGHYQVQMKYSRIMADSVDFYNTAFFKVPLKGRYTDKVLTDVAEEKATYPRFASYDNLIGIHDLFANIDYLGGFAMEGAKVIGNGNQARDAQLAFKKNEQDFVKIRSKSFVIHKDRINSGMASITIYHENDSIYHPGLQMKYMDEKKELTLTRDERVATISPWFDSFHNIEIYCEELSWKMNEPKIDFEMMKGPNMEGRAVFESSNYFSQQRYERLQGLDEFNPCYIIKRFLEQKKSRTFTLDELSQYMKKPPNQVESIILMLGTKGFLIYDFDDKVARVNEKLFDYVKAMNALIDYDVLNFNSNVSGKSNAILNLENFDLKIQGVSKVFLSDSQQVYIYPVRQEVILKKDRDFLFSGKVEAGMFDFFAKECSFEYGKFKLNLPTIDSMSFYVRSRTKDPKTQQYQMVRVKTVISGLSGDLLIDDPRNKSGLKQLRQYPIFNSKNEASVHWEKKSIQNGVYKKDKFFYKVTPFTLKNIGRLPTDSLQFKGYLSTAGIFPDMQQPLVLRPDYSMGIEKVTGEGGIPLYGGKGTFISRIDLSNAGLRGNGKIVYLNSTSASDDFVFYPDSMKTLAKSFIQKDLAGVTEFPSVRGDSVRETWIPYKDSLVVQTTRKDLAMYGDQSAFAGHLAVTPAGLTGQGTIKIKDAEMDSKFFQFKQKTFDANIANFRIKAYNLSDLSISTKNYQTHFDFEKRKSEFKSNVGISKVEFPFNKYICSMDRFDWLIDNDEISLYNERSAKVVRADTMSLSRLIDYDMGGTEFISVHPAQDSLRFFVLSARYNLKTNIINCQDVKVIRVADAAIFPDSGKIRILPDARIEPLHKSGIIANTSQKFHQFYNSDISIWSRKKYGADGFYDYTDRDGKKESLKFTKIAVDTTGHTYASGVISDSANFRLSPEFAFQGDVRLKADRRELEFEGGFKTITDCLKPLESGVQFKAVINPVNVQIPVPDLVQNIHHEKLALGMLYSNRDSRIYPSFFLKKESFSDSVMIASSGLVGYSTATNEFRITTQEKMKNPNVKDNLLSLNTSKCQIHGEGKINTGMNSGPLQMESFGILDYFIIPDSTTLNISIALNFPFSEPALERFYSQLNSINLKGITIYNTPYLSAMRNFLEKKEFDKLRSEMEMTGKFKKFPEALIRTLFLAEVHLKWDSVNKSWVSFGPIGIGNVMKNQVYRYVTGKIEFAKKRNGDDFTLYLELTKDDWYFFNYRNNILQAMSSNLGFNDLIINAEKSKSEQSRINSIARGYRYVISTDRKKRDFLKKFETEE
ncbi:MAG: hypothetical protein NTX61_15280 [Bacteroidetes bacterium]|nr:hypothetical protein [Bacteroidota bacterium]